MKRIIRCLCVTWAMLLYALAHRVPASKKQIERDSQRRRR